ncbi:MAG: MATE family efflux transporter [Spirochaetales bacterium]|nr:MATE family efflux transporter [Spirochaetales bacterium]
MKKARRIMTEGPIPPILIKMAAGMLFGFIAMSAFNAVDTYFVGRLGAMELAAMSYTFPVVMVLNSIALGLGVGLSSNVSRAIGAGKNHLVKRLTTDGLILAVLVVVVIGFFGILTIEPLFSLLGAEGRTLNLIKSYMTIWYFGIPFVVIPMVGNNVIRATGDTLTPSLIMITSVFVNVILDPLMIFGIGPFPAMGISGAALATVIARLTTFFFSLGILGFREKLLSFERPHRSEVLSNWKQIAYIGVPAALVQAINPLTLGVLTRILAGFGDEVVAGFGAAGRLEFLIMGIPAAFGTVMAPFAGQNWGAKKIDRIKEGARFSALASLLWGAVIFIVFLFTADSVIGLFSANPVVRNAGASYLKIMAIGYGFSGILMIASQSLNAVNKPLHSAGVTITKSFVINIPLAWFGSRLLLERGVFSASLIANVTGGVLGLIMLFALLNRRLSQLREAAEVPAG